MKIYRAHIEYGERSQTRDIDISNIVNTLTREGWLVFVCQDGEEWMFAREHVFVAQIEVDRVEEPSL